MTTYTSNTSVIIPANAANIRVTVAGARGGTGGSDGNPGGSGGNGRVGTFTLPDFTTRTLTFNIASVGSNGFGCVSNSGSGAGGSGVASGGAGGRTGPQGCSGGGAGGGGATGVYDSLSNAWIIVAAGGGGGGGASYPDSYLRGGTGGDGGGWGSTTNVGGNISNGGTGASQGFDGGGGGGGGGGAPGGGGGREGADDRAGRYASGGGGGGGSLYHSSYVTYNSADLNSSSGYVTLTYNLVNPTVDSFTASPSSVIRGNSSTLSWGTTNATSVSINQGVGNVPVDGSVEVTPFNTTIYTLTATGPGNTSTTAQVQVTVYEPPVVTLSLDRNPIITGESTTLRWTTTGDADNITISPGISNQNLNSFTTVSPTNTITYNAYVSGLGGTDTDSITLRVYQRPTVTINGPTELFYGQQGTITYSSLYANIGLRVTPVYQYFTDIPDDDGLVTGTVVNLPTASSAESGGTNTSVSGSFTTSIPYTDKGPPVVYYNIEAIGDGGLATSQTIVSVRIDLTPDNIIVPETEDVYKLQDPIITPDTTITSTLIEITDIDIPVEVKSDKPIKVDINQQEDWKDIRQL